MTHRLAYDRDYEPAAPVIPIRIARPGDETQALAIAALLDTGADCSLVPERIVQILGLPQVDSARIVGVEGTPRRAPVVAGSLHLGRTSKIVRLVSLGTEAILGRDLMAAWVVTLDGPRQSLALTAPASRRRAR